jgi:restriction system protein
MAIRLILNVDRAKQAVAKFINEQATVLARRRAQLIYTDTYGIEQTDKWDKEKKYILSKVIPEHLTKLGHSQDSIWKATKPSFWSFPPRSPVLAALDKAAQSVKIDHLHPDFSEVATGIEHENFCAEKLRRAGWSARVTVATGDQGTDIVAERGGKRVVFQCKLYSKPVGNKAVQEAAAARMHERADLAIVVSNASYTRSARQLAGTTGVMLLHHNELSSFDVSSGIAATSEKR